MIGYLKRRSDFATYAMLDIGDYDYCAASIYDDTSKFTVLGELTDTISSQFRLVSEDVEKLKKLYINKRRIICKLYETHTRDKKY